MKIHRDRLYTRPITT